MTYFSFFVSHFFPSPEIKFCLLDTLGISILLIITALTHVSIVSPFFCFSWITLREWTTALTQVSIVSPFFLINYSLLFLKHPVGCMTFNCYFILTELSKDDIKRGRPQKCLNVEVGRVAPMAKTTLNVHKRPSTESSPGSESTSDVRQQRRHSKVRRHLKQNKTKTTNQNAGKAKP